MSSSRAIFEDFQHFLMCMKHNTGTLHVYSFHSMLKYVRQTKNIIANCICFAGMQAESLNCYAVEWGFFVRQKYSTAIQH